jgi:hypothetical protein
MTKENIEELISEKSEPTKEIYDAIYYAIDFFYNELDDNTKSILSYNCSLFLMKAIHNNTSYFVSKFEIQPNELECIKEDIDTMEHIDYPENNGDPETTIIESFFNDSIIHRMEDDLKMEQYYKSINNDD